MSTRGLRVQQHIAWQAHGGKPWQFWALALWRAGRMTGQPPPVAPANRRDGKGALGSSDFTAVRRVNDFKALVWHDVGIHEDTCAHSHLPQVLSDFRGTGVEPKLIFVPNELHF